MVEEKIIHYNDGLIIECMSESKARMLVPHKDFEYFVKNEIDLFNIFKERLAKDFNFITIGNIYLKTECTNKYMIFYFTRKVIPIK